MRLATTRFTEPFESLFQQGAIGMGGALLWEYQLLSVHFLKRMTERRSVMFL